jgi:hypothetical protein
MKAIEVREFGGPDVLTYTDVPVPSPGPGQVLVRVRAAGVGRRASGLGTPGCAKAAACCRNPCR